MDQNFQTSFIPKRPLIEKQATAARPVSLATGITLLIFFIMLVVSGGLYFYKGILKSNIAKMDASLNLSKNRFEPEKIKQLKILDQRLQSANEILSNHITVSPIFEVLQVITMKTIRYTQFSYSVDTEKNTKVLVKLNGQADGYKSIALQSELFTMKAKDFIDPVFFNLSLDDKGNVSFDLEFSVDLGFVNYKKSLASQVPPEDLPSINVPENEN